MNGRTAPPWWTGLFILVALLLVPAVEGRSGSIAALSTATDETGNHTFGDVVDIALEIKPGRGAIYIESMPLTRLDTQMSARLAVETACERADTDCHAYDFFYVIRTNGAVIGGPSAGAALTVLTYAVLEGETIRNDTAITGAILSGGVIGPVGSVPEKIAGASRRGYRAALVPAFDEDATAVSHNNREGGGQQQGMPGRSAGDRLPEGYGTYGVVIGRDGHEEGQGNPGGGRREGSEDDAADDLASGGVEVSSGIEVVRIATVDDAIAWYTGKDVRRGVPLDEAPQEYRETMARIASTLCERSMIIRSNALNEIDGSGVQEGMGAETRASAGAGNGSAEEPTARLEEAGRQYDRAMEAIGRGAFYTGASQCFGSSMIAQEVLLTTADAQTRQNVLAMVRRGREAMREAIERSELSTLTDLEASMIANARLSDVDQALEELDDDDPDPSTLAYASERLETARAWFGVVGRIESEPFDLSQDALDASCRRKLDEARERVNYASYLYPGSAEQLEESVRSAFSAAQRQHSGLCILQASMAKAEANALLTALSVPEDDFAAVAERKAAVARERIGDMTSQDAFPILAYSYAEYAGAFDDDELATRALYTEYALELAMLPTALQERASVIRFDQGVGTVFGLGVIVGIVFGIVGGFFLFRTGRPPRTARNPSRR